MNKRMIKTYSDNDLLDEIEKAHRQEWTEKQVDTYINPFINELKQRKINGGGVNEKQNGKEKNKQ